MTYSLEVSEEARAQIDALPDQVVAAIMPHSSAHRSTSLSGPIEPLEDRQMLSGGSSSQPLRSPDDYLSEHLTTAEVQAILAQAASQLRRIYPGPDTV